MSLSQCHAWRPWETLVQMNVSLEHISVCIPCTRQSCYFPPRLLIHFPDRVFYLRGKYLLPDFIQKLVKLPTKHFSGQEKPRD